MEKNNQPANGNGPKKKTGRGKIVLIVIALILGASWYSGALQEGIRKGKVRIENEKCRKFKTDAAYRAAHEELAKTCPN